jgi:hypothetical protein
VTQGCDIVRDIADEPFLHIAPLIEVTQKEWDLAHEGRYSVRRFSYPSPIEGHELLALDIRVIQTIEKTALLDGSVTPIESKMNDPLRAKLSYWLGRRFARFAFPDDLEENVLSHLRSQIRDKIEAQSPSGALIRSAEGIWIKFGQSPVVKVMIVLNVAKTLKEPILGGDEKKIAQAADQLLNPIKKKADAASYQIEPEVRTPSKVNAFDLMYEYHPLDVPL